MKNLSILLLGIIVIISCEKKSENGNKPLKQIPAVTEKIPVPQYTIVQENDISYASIKRLQIKLRVQNVLAEEEIKAVCTTLIPKYKDLKYIAVSFEFYLSDSDIKGAFTAGMAEWAPYGNWSQAESINKGDYSKHSLSITVSKPVSWVDRTNIPIEKRKKIFYDLVAEEDRLFALGEKDHSLKARKTIVNKYNLTIEQLKKIAFEGIEKDWPMP